MMLMTIVLTVQVGVEVDVFGELRQALRLLLFPQSFEFVCKDCGSDVFRC